MSCNSIGIVPVNVIFSLLPVLAQWKEAVNQVYMCVLINNQVRLFFFIEMTVMRLKRKKAEAELWREYLTWLIPQCEICNPQCVQYSYKVNSILPGESAFLNFCDSLSAIVLWVVAALGLLFPSSTLGLILLHFSSLHCEEFLWMSEVRPDSYMRRKV